MTSIFEQIKLLYDQQLYSNLVVVADLVLSASNHSNDLLSPLAKFQTLVYYGESLFHNDRYRKAENIFREALQLRKSFMKNKETAKLLEQQKDLFSDIEIKYQIHLCHVNLRQNDQAINTLQSIPGKQRNPKINMALAKLYQQGGMERSAITAYKEVLRECPLALEAAEGLLSVGVKGVEVNSLMIEAVSGLDWLIKWIKGHAHLHGREYQLAIATFQDLRLCSPLRDNHSILVSLGEAYHHSGEGAHALSTLQNAFLSDPTMIRGLDALASQLYQNKKFSELEKIVPPLWYQQEHNKPEIFTTLGYLLYANNNPNRACYLVHKACLLCPKNIEALILKGALLYEIKKFQDAAIHFKEAIQVAPYRHEPHKGLIDCYIAMHRIREAVTIASNACKQLGQTPRALVLYATVLMKDPVTVCKAKNLLEKALAQNETCLPAVYLLAEIYEQEMNLEAAISLLERQVSLTPNCRLHQMLGDLLSRMHEDEKAFNHYQSALNLDPNNRRALEGMNRLDQLSTSGMGGAGKLDSSYYNMSDAEQADTSYDVNHDHLAEFSDHEASSEVSL
nr:PREDICTED: anaphase-promoting complex subunit 7 [Bemisia tabaci]